MIDHMGDVLMGAAAMIQAFNLFLCGYLLKRIDQSDRNLIQHERDKH